MYSLYTFSNFDIYWKVFTLLNDRGIEAGAIIGHSGGEIAAAVVTDSIVRLIPGVLNDETSALSDSFQDGLLSPPVYTRPFDFKGFKVPEILLSGNEKVIVEWKHQQALERTQKRRPDLLE